MLTRYGIADSRGALTALAGVPAQRIVRAIAHAAERWRNADFPARVRATQRVVNRTGYSLPVVEYALDRLFLSITDEALAQTIAGELGSLAVLDGFVQRPGRPDARVLPVGRVCVISSRTTVGVALPAALFALCAKCDVLVKDHEDSLIAAFFETLHQELDEFRDAAQSAIWSSSDESAPDLASYGAVVAFGSDETLRTIRDAVPIDTRFIGFGSRASAGYVARESLTDSDSAARIAGGAARDLVLYETEGCLSLHVLFLERGSVEPLQFCRLLAAAVERANLEFSRGSIDASQDARARQALALGAFRESSGHGAVFSDGNYGILLDPPEDRPPEFLARTLDVRTVDSPRDALRYVQEHRIPLEALALSDDRQDLVQLAIDAGAARIARFGELQDPPLSGNHGARPRIAEFVRWIDTAGEDGPFELVRTAIPGPRARELARSLRLTESRNVTYLSEDFPIFWSSASGATVSDADGNRYIDLTAAFGVANVGHGNPAVVEAANAQARRLPHAMGDVHPADVKVRLLERLAEIAPGSLQKTFLASTGADAIEAAMKTAILATGKSAFAAYRGAYHGLSFGTLEIAGVEKFRAPFRDALLNNSLLLDYPRGRDDVSEALARARSALNARNDIAALILEPIQGRAGCIVPPKGYLAGIRALCDELGILMILDEIFTGFGRTGYLFACEHDEIVPDILCIGKAMSNGFQLSAAIAKPEIMDAWPPSAGEALHTSTFLGHPVACAAAIATIEELQARHLPARARELGVALGARLRTLVDSGTARAVSGRGLMWGIELQDAAHAHRVVTKALARGVILLQAGVEGNVVSLTPPLVISQEQLFRAIDITESCL